MRGLELEHNMLDNGASFEYEAKTAPCYRFVECQRCVPCDDSGSNGRPDAAAIDVEVWRVRLGARPILDGEPPGLAIGKIKLDDDRIVFGVIANR